jgi:hypothetical protein
MPYTNQVSDTNNGPQHVLPLSFSRSSLESWFSKPPNTSFSSSAVHSSPDFLANAIMAFLSPFLVSIKNAFLNLLSLANFSTNFLALLRLVITY